jgi:hypothetical protein
VSDTATEGSPPKLRIETYSDQKFQQSDGSFAVLFNPSEYTLTRSNAWNQTQAPGNSRPTSSFRAGNPDQLALSLFFDGTGAAGKTGSVRPDVDKVLDLLRYQGDGHKPRFVKLVWGGPGGGLNFQCYVKSASVAFTLFARSGEPIRAKIQATFEEVLDPEDRIAHERRASPDLRRLWHVKEGETLDLIAHRAYGDVRYWRELARANNLENPRSLVPGTALLLPRKAR